MDVDDLSEIETRPNRGNAANITPMDGDTLSELEKKIVALSTSINAENSSLEKYVERSELFYESKLYKQALEDAKTAIEGGEQTVRAYIAAGRACMELGNFNECYAYYKEGLVHDPKNATITEDLKDFQVKIVSEYKKQSEAMPETEYNAVSMCSQDYYPGDDELYIMENEILEKKYKLTTKVDSIKTVDLPTKKEAASLGVMAHNCHEAKQLNEAIHYCHAALAKDPSNFRLLQMRAEVFHGLKEEISALQDLFLIPKPYRSPEVWKLGGKILSTLDLPITTEFWLRKATTLPNKEKDVEAATLFQKIRVRRIYGPHCQGYDVAVDFKDYGRAIVATSKLTAGENAFSDVPLVLGQIFESSHHPGCWFCGKSLISPQDYFGRALDSMQNDLRSFVEDNWPDVSGAVCRECKRERYCSTTCRDEAWQCYHQIICPSRNPAASELYDIIENKGHHINEKGLKEDVWGGQYSPIILAKIWAMIIAEAKRLMRESGVTEPTADHWSRAKMMFRKFISFGSVSAVERTPVIFELMKKIFSDCGDGVSFPISESEFEARYYQATCNLQAFSPSITPKNIFMKNISELEDLRAMAIIKYLDKPQPISFAGMFPLHACLNHACDNNCEVMDGYMDGKPAVHVRVRRDIEPGEELFTTYIDTAMPRRLRRAWLFKSFNFWCFCRRCQFEGDDNTTCTTCKKAATEGKKFPACSRCKRAWYCSTKCQKQGWVKGHKAVCQMVHTSVKQVAVRE